MKLFHKAKDGGPKSLVTGYWLIESKRFGSIVLLSFDKGSREAYHTHAFDAVSWVVKGSLREVIRIPQGEYEVMMKPRLLPYFTGRDRFHRVFGCSDKTWALSFRGPWKDKWKEYLPKEDKNIVLTHGRKIVE